MTDINYAHCLMTDAIETAGIGYWAEVRNVKRNAENEVVSFEVREETPSDNAPAPWATVNEGKVRQAAKDMRDGKCSVHRQIAAQFIGDSGDDWDYDSTGVDCIVQWIALGKVIYG